MAREKGTLEASLEKTLHHVCESKVRMAEAGIMGPQNVAYRFKLVSQNLQPVLKAIYEIREAAKQGDCQKVLNLLDGPVEFGHDFGKNF